MFDETLYFNGLNVFSNNLSYCVDMLRVSTQISYELFQRKIVSRETILKDKLTVWNSSKICDFHFNYNYHDDDCSFWFGFMSNKEKLDKKNNSRFCTFNFTVEFNPNKVKNCSLLLCILKMSTEWVVKQVDFAVDIPVNIRNLCGFDKGRKECLMTYDCGGDNKTYYIGKKNNRVKIYNKTLESGLNCDLTRVEITKYLDNLKISDIASYRYDGYFPELFMSDYQLAIDDLKDKTLSALVFAVNSGFPLHDLSRKYKEKVKNFLQKKKPIDIDFKCFNKCFLNYIFYYFFK